MSASGMLDAQNVLFYHPMNLDRTEVVLNQEWEGPASFTDGKVDDALIGAFEDSILYHQESTFRDGTLPTPTKHRHKIIKLSSDKLLMTYSTGSAATLRAIAGHVSGTNILWGNHVNIGTSTPTFSSPAAVSGNRAVVTWWASDNNGHSKVLTVSGLNSLVVSSGDFQYETGHTEDFSDCCPFDESGVVLVYKTGAGSPAPSEAKGKVGIVTGSGVSASINWGSAQVYEPNFTRHNSVEKVSPTQVVVGYLRFTGVGNPEDLFIQAGIVDTENQTISWGARVSVESNLGSNSDEIIVHNIQTTTTSDEIFGVVYRNRPNNAIFAQLAYLGSQATTIIALSDNEQVASISNGTPHFGVAPIADDKYVISYRDTDGSCRSVVVKFIEDSATPDNNQIQLVTDGETIFDDDGRHPWIEDFSNNRVVLAFKDSDDSDKGKALFADLGVSGSQLTGSDYPESDNDIRLNIVFWSQNIIDPGSGLCSNCVRIDPFNVELSSDSGVTFASGNVVHTWVNVTLPDHDDQSHFLALEFLKQDTMNLKVSIDGNPYTDYSLPDSSLPLFDDFFANSQPGVTLNTPSGVTEKWIDEVAVWSGVPLLFNEFSNQELQNLHDLGDVHGLQLNQYQNTFGLDGDQANTLTLFIGEQEIPSVTGSMDLYIQCPFNFLDTLDLFIQANFTANLNLFISGDTDEPTDTLVAQVINRFTKTADYNPVLIGSFDPDSAVTATVEIWDLSNGDNSIINLKDNNCFRISDTGRFGWSFENMPESHILDGNFVFRMTANNGQVFIEEFVLTTVERGRWKSS